MSTEIYYFSGTGNSLHVAKELEKRVPEAKLIPIVSLLDKEFVKTRGDTVGFVFPIYGMTIPIPVKKFVKKLDLKSAQYIFGIATRGGTKHNAFVEIEKVLDKKGKRLNSYFNLTMPSNDPKLEDWNPVTNEELTELDSEIQSRLDSIQRIIINRGTSHEKDLDGVTFPFIFPVNSLLESLVRLAMFYTEFDGLKDYFYSNSNCTGCKTCERVCLSEKIKIVDNKPVWKKNIKCYMCYACLNFCPTQAVQIKSKWYMKSFTEDNERYPHPYATVNDIAEQKTLLKQNTILLDKKTLRSKLNENRNYSPFIH